MHDKKGNLILTRNIGESIIIGDNIEVIVLDVKGYQVRISVNAPRDLSVHRKEIWEKIERQKNCGPHECIDYIEYHFDRLGTRTATCDMCGKRWGCPEDDEQEI